MSACPSELQAVHGRRIGHAAAGSRSSSGWWRQQAGVGQHLRFRAADTPLLFPAPAQPPQKTPRPHPQCLLLGTAARPPAACSQPPSAARCRAARLRAYGGVRAIKYNQVPCTVHYNRCPRSTLQPSPRSTFSAAAAGSSAAAWRRAAAPCAARSCSAGAAADVALGRPLGVQGRWGVEIENRAAWGQAEGVKGAGQAAGSQAVCSLCTGLGAPLHGC